MDARAAAAMARLDAAGGPLARIWSPLPPMRARTAPSRSDWIARSVKARGWTSRGADRRAGRRSSREHGRVLARHSGPGRQGAPANSPSSRPVIPAGGGGATRKSGHYVMRRQSKLAWWRAVGTASCWSRVETGRVVRRGHRHGAARFQRGLSGSARSAALRAGPTATGDDLAFRVVIECDDEAASSATAPEHDLPGKGSECKAVDILIETPRSARSARWRQLEGMFDVPRQDVAAAMEGRDHRSTSATGASA